MLGLNVIWVFDPTGEKVLMCKRHKEPYKGLYNLVGGKIEPLNRGGVATVAAEGSGNCMQFPTTYESGLAAAYRELKEETGITEITLSHLMDFTYFMKDSCRVEVYFGRLDKHTEVSGDEKELVWLSTTEDFFDKTRFAGEGNIGHIFEIIKQNI